MNGRVLRQFNRSAEGSYDIHATVQRRMADRLAGTLADWRLSSDTQDRYRTILEIGCGTGYLTGMLVKEWPEAAITALDLAPAMIEAAGRRLLKEDNACRSLRGSQANRLSLLQADIEIWVKNAESSSYDLIVSNACFQWLRDPGQTVSHLGRMLRSGGLLVFSTFGPNTFCELHHAFEEAYRSYGRKPERHGPALRSCGDWRPLLEQAGFSDVECERVNHREKYASVRDFLHAVKGMGASASEAAPVPGLALRQLFDSMYREYEARYHVQGGIAATYDMMQIKAVFREEI